VFVNIRAKQNSHVVGCNMYHTMQILVEQILSIFFCTCVIVSNCKI